MIDAKTYAKVNGFNDIEFELLYAIKDYNISLDTIKKNIKKLIKRLPEGDYSDVTADMLPKHYSDAQYEPIDYIIENGLDFCEGNIVKYITRYKSKNRDKDLKKVWFYFYVLRNKTKDGITEL